MLRCWPSHNGTVLGSQPQADPPLAESPSGPTTPAVLLLLFHLPIGVLAPLNPAFPGQLVTLPWNKGQFL
jgi:hypothetical protein